MSEKGKKETGERTARNRGHHGHPIQFGENAAENIFVPGAHSFEPASEADLPPEAAALIGTQCDWDDCSCRISPNVTCQVVRVEQGWVPACISNAKKGDLILCPGDGRGSIGSLLGALQTPQVYSHMGIMVDNFNTIRHSTAVSKRMQAYPVGGVLGLPLPTHGFEPDKVKYSWPGTITQSVDEALAATMPSAFLPVPDGQTAPYLYCDRDNGTQPFAQDDADHFCFKIAELSFAPVFGIGNSRREPLIVQPCTVAEMEHPEVRDILHDIAEEAKGIAGHYRFYAYTNAAIAEDPAFQAPGAMPLYRWDPGEKHWKPIENTLFDPLNPCAVPGDAAPVSFTVPVVCSSLIWLAVRRFNLRGHKFQVLLDTDDQNPTFSHPDEPPLPPGCLRLVPTQPTGDVPDPEGKTPDGCYFFTESDRANVASSFYAGLKQQVLDEINGKWHDIVVSIEKLEGKSLPLLFSVAFVFGAAEAALWSLASLSAALGISEASASLIIDVFTSMQEHIANQLVNSFASDNAGSADETSDAWKTPGIGRAVGPDDIVWFWDPTFSLEKRGDKTVVRGIYGQNRKLILQQPGFGSAPICQWAFSPGPGKLSGMVRLKGQPMTGPGVPGASVIIACENTITNHDGFYSLGLPAGTYWAKATWQDPKTEDFWQVSEAVKIEFNGNDVHDFILNPPPLDFRQVVIDVEGDAVDTTISAKGWTHIFSSGFIPLGPRGNPADSSDTRGLTGSWGSGDMRYSGDNTVTVNVDADLSLKGHVAGSVTANLVENGDVEHSETVKFGPLAPGTSVSIPFSMSTGGWFPDKAAITVTINNEQGYGPQ